MGIQSDFQDRVAGKENDKLSDKSCSKTLKDVKVFK